MPNNPYQAPRTTSQVTGVLSGSRDDLRLVAQYQKGIIICILVQLIAMFGRFALPQSLQFVAIYGMFLAGIASAVFVFLLAIKVYGTGKGVLFGILALIPLIGLIVLLVINGKATAILKENGITVGFLGADPSSI